MKLKTLAFVLGAAVSGLVQAATGGMPDTVNIVYVKAPFNLQNIVMKDRQMLEKAFKPYGTEVKWHTITSGAKQGQAMAAGAIDVSAVMNTASRTPRIPLRSSAQKASTTPSKTSRVRKSQGPAAQCCISSSLRRS